ncbi:Transient receptor potential cation channel subfamily A member 1 [Trichoplax sp. H2]|nr:Transient receptor potential cation channel subfamily A member 1 [Trichoplax sp. H2]|eukprot:RDD41722.1 Transient receptor potential cation channel subfamily A member 1 [Trichoplax sp. H2]
MKKTSKIKAFDQNVDDEPDRHNVRFINRWKFPSWGSKKNMNRSSTIEHGINTMFVKVSDQQKRSKSTTSSAVNNSLVSLGFAVANTKARDLYEAIKKSSIEEIENLLALNYYRDKINSVDKENSFTFMHYAARYNRSDVITCLIGSGADVNSKSGRDGIAPLHVAAQHNCTKAAQTLIQFGAKLCGNSKAKEGPLHFCCKYGSEGVAEIILREAEKLNITGKIVNHPDNESYYPIHFAALYNKERMIDILLKYGASIVKKNINGRLPSHFAAERKDTSILEHLLQYAKIKGQNDYIMISNNEGGTALHVAADVGSIAAAEVCLKYNADIEAQTYELLTPFHIAAMNGNYEFAEFLTKRGAKINSKDNEGKTCLHYAALSNNLPLIELMIQQGADIEVRDNKEHTPLLSAVYKGCSSAVKKLLELGADITATDSNGRHCLHYLAEQADLNTLLILLENGGKQLIDRPDNKGIVPLRLAALAGTIGAVYYLVQNGASPHILDEEGNTLLHLAAKGNHRDTIKHILEDIKTKDINVRNTFGQKPIHIAAKYGHNRVVHNMIRNGADINSKDIYSYYPLHYAAKGGFNAVVQLLVSKNVKINVLDRSDNTPLHLASANGHQEVTKILLASGADPTTINNQGQNCLDIAIENEHAEIGLQIISSKYWEKVLENREFDGQTPMKRLIEKLPAVASYIYLATLTDVILSLFLPECSCFKKETLVEEESMNYILNRSMVLSNLLQAVMDRCVTYTNEIGESKEEEILFNFAYLETPPFQTRHKKVDDGYLAASSILSHNRIKLMKHPLIRAYRHYKWNSLLRYLYYGKVFVNLVFLLAVCVPVSLNIGNYYEAVRNQTASNAVGAAVVAQYSEAVYTRNIVTFCAVVFNIFINLTKYLFQPRKLKQIGIINDTGTSILEIGVELLVLLYCIPFERPTTNFTVQMGALIIFLSIINFLVHLKRAFGIGLYLTMFLTIMKTIIRASLVIILFLTAFAIACYMVLRQLPEFSEFGYAFIRVLTMMVGDISYRETFQHLYDTNQLQHSSLALIIIVLFVIVINIAFANLLVGLAVGDINEVRSNADISLIQMDLSYISDVRTCHLPKWLRVYFSRSALVLRKHQKIKLREKYEWEKLTEGVQLQVPTENAAAKCKTITMLEELREQHLEIKDMSDKFTDFRSDVFQRLYRMEQEIKKANEDTTKS